ncbi:MAG TPA: hypothetical protein VHZ31_06795 [Solirubrobacteraceae bacterium]|jgi:hypothetical protein|nr:hypothetical protein [Solirubrobacteraceae bacterium]
MAAEDVLLRLKLQGEQAVAAGFNKTAAAVDGVSTAQVEARAKAVALESAVAKAAVAVQKYGEDSLQARAALVRVDQAQIALTASTRVAAASTEVAATRIATSTASAGKHAEAFGAETEHAFSRIREAGKGLGEIAGISALAFGLKDVTEEAVKAEAEQLKLANTVKDAGLSWGAHSREIDEWLDKTSRASGFAKSDLTASLGNLIRTTGSVAKARKLDAQAMDVARSKGIGLAGAQSLLARVYNGSFLGLKRLGIEVKPVTAAQDKLKASTGASSAATKLATAAQMQHARALDSAATRVARLGKAAGQYIPAVTTAQDALRRSTTLGAAGNTAAGAAALKVAKAQDTQATRTEALGLVTKKFGGQSAAYAKSTAGQFDRAKASLQLMEEKVGKVVLPIMAKAASAIASIADSAAKHWPQISATAKRVFGPVAHQVTALAGDIGSLVHWIAKNKEAVLTLVGPVTAYIAAMKAWAIAQAIATAVTEGFATGFWALNAAMDANPIGVIVVGLAALAAGLVYAYHHSETFRNAVNGAWGALKDTFSWIKGHWVLLGGILTFGLVPAVALIVKNFKTIEDAGKSVIDTVIGLFNTGFHAINAVTPGKKKVLGVTVFPGIPDIPDIPKLATGGTIAQGGAAIVGERGPEVVQLPTGSRVHDAAATAVMRGGGLQALIAALDRQSAAFERASRRPLSLQIDGRELARAVANQRANEAAFS